MQRTSATMVRRLKIGIRCTILGAMAAWLCLAVAGQRERKILEIVEHHHSVQFTANHLGDLFPSSH